MLNNTMKTDIEYRTYFSIYKQKLHFYTLFLKKCTNFLKIIKYKDKASIASCLPVKFL